MKKINELMKSPERCRMSEYLLEYRLCCVPGCKICAGIGKEVRTQHIYAGNYNIRDEVIR